MLRRDAAVRLPHKGLVLRPREISDTYFDLEVWPEKRMPAPGVYGPGLQPVAHISVSKPHRGHSIVVDVAVNDELRRKGIGTALYEQAAKLSCERFGRPLGSDIRRSTQADGFWRKQESRGRARCIRRSKRRPDWCSSYVLTCPAPASLAGYRRRAR